MIDRTDPEYVEYLEAMIDQACNTIGFLHNCLINPPKEGVNGGYVYGYPSQTLRELERLRRIVPDGPMCLHSKVDPNCESCMIGVRHRQLYAKFERDE